MAKYLISKTGGDFNSRNFCNTFKEPSDSLPENTTGLTNTEIPVTDSCYVDLIMNEEVKDKTVKRLKIIKETVTSLMKEDLWKLEPGVCCKWQWQQDRLKLITNALDEDVNSYFL